MTKWLKAKLPLSSLSCDMAEQVESHFFPIPEEEEQEEEENWGQGPALWASCWGKDPRKATITPEEVKDAVKRLNTVKTSGRDRVPPLVMRGVENLDPERTRKLLNTVRA